MNTHIIQNSSPLVYNGHEVTVKAEMISLTDMWKAAGSPANREPYNWARFEGRPFIEAAALAHNLSDTQVIRTKKGKGGGTWAHWQASMAYAQYLSPEFHMWCNEVVRERMEGKAAQGLPADVLEQIERGFGISRMLAHKVTGIETTVQTLASVVSSIATLVHGPASGIYVTGKTAGEIWKDHGFPPIKVTSWFSNRLVKMGCQIDDGRRIPVGLGRAKLFDPDKADNWLRNGGRKLVEEYLSRRRGQGKLHLISGRA